MTDREPASGVHRDSHLGTALLVYAPLGHALTSVGAQRLALAGAVLAVGCCGLPDVDGRVRELAHRGVTHSATFAAAVGALAGALARAAVQAGLHAPVSWPGACTSPGDLAGGVAFAVAVTSVMAHLGADALTPMGVPVLWPASRRRYGLGLVTADAPLANHVLFVSGIAATLSWLPSLGGSIS